MLITLRVMNSKGAVETMEVEAGEICYWRQPDTKLNIKAGVGKGTADMLLSTALVDSTLNAIAFKLWCQHWSGKVPCP